MHTATSNLAHKFSKLVQKVPDSVLQATKAHEHATDASASKPGKKDAKKPVVGAMDAFVKPAAHNSAVSSVPTGAAGSTAGPASNKTKVCSTCFELGIHTEHSGSQIQA